MSDPSAAPDDRSPRWLIPLFFLSGISGLVYEVVWVRMLIRAFGVTIYAVSTVLVVFMTGLALGSFLVGHKLRRRDRLLSFYAVTEVAIGFTAMASTMVILLLPDVSRALAPIVGTSGVGATIARFVLSAVVLLPPTLLMGATLPMISGHVAADHARLSQRVGLLYGINTLGAVFGVLGSGLFSLMLLGELRSVVVAAVLNVVVGGLAYAIARRTPAQGPAATASEAEAPHAPGDGGQEARLARTLMWLYGVSGLAALGYQVIWSRMLTLVLGNSVYAFSLTLAAYLLGIGIGSLVMARLTDRIAKPLLVFGVLEMLLAFLAIGSLHVFQWLGLSEQNTGATYAQIRSLADFPRLGLNALVIVLPVTIVLGALFPLVAKLCAAGHGFTQETVGRLYGMNTVGSIVGSFVAGFLLIPYFGTLNSFLLLAAVSFAIGAWLLRADAVSRHRPTPRVPVLIGTGLFVVVLSFSFEDPFVRVLVRHLELNEKIVLHVEDKAATISAVESVASEGAEPWKHLYINGIVTSSTDFQIGNMMVYLPLTFHPAPKRSLIVGLGVGEAFRASLDMKLDTTVVDLVPSIVGFFEYFHPRDHQKYLSDPNGRIIVNDGRNFLLTTSEKFDFVFVDGTPPVYSSGTVNLYSREFTQLVKERLNDGGIYALWFPTHCFESDFWVVARNFADLFPHVTLWAYPQTSGIILAGTTAKDAIFDAPPEVLAERLAARATLNRPGRVTLDIIQVGMILSEPRIRDKASAYPPLTDDRPYTELPLANFMRGEKYHLTNEFVFKIADRVVPVSASVEGAGAL